MRSYPIIGVCGKARSGKDTVARFLLADGHARYQYSLADPLKAMLAAGLGVDMRDPYWQERKEDIIPAFGKSPRQMMQTLGTEWGRQCVNDNLWLIMAQDRLNRNGPGMVIADIRFDNEAAFVRRMGGTVVHVFRDSAPAVNSHASESGIVAQPSDMVLHNNGSLEELQANVRKLFG